MATNLTLEDIGRLTGVSKSTVSRVINGHASVRPEVRDRVLAAIRQTGYSPNAAARSLVSGRTGLIGLVIPSRVHSLFEDPYFGRLIQGISAACNTSGTSLSLFLFQTPAEEEALYPRVTNAGFFDGLILTATRMRDPLLSRLVHGDLPVVVVGRPDLDGVSYVDVDNRGGAFAMAVHLSDCGHSRVALIGAPTDTTAGFDRLEGFVEGLASRGLSLDPALRIDGDFSESSGYAAMERLLPHRPSAVFAASDTMAIGALRCLLDNGVRVPDDIALAGFDGSPLAQHSSPQLTTVYQDVVGTGSRAVEILDRLIDPSTAGEQVTEVMPVELIARASTCHELPKSADDGEAG